MRAFELAITPNAQQISIRREGQDTTTGLAPGESQYPVLRIHAHSGNIMIRPTLREFAPAFNFLVKMLSLTDGPHAGVSEGCPIPSPCRRAAAVCSVAVLKNPKSELQDSMVMPNAFQASAVSASPTWMPAATP